MYIITNKPPGDVITGEPVSKVIAWSSPVMSLTDMPESANSLLVFVARPKQKKVKSSFCIPCMPVTLVTPKSKRRKNFLI